ncbi:MAG: hypothetical protein ACKOX3_10625 [Bacteroidota bacterium]
MKKLVFVLMLLFPIIASAQQKKDLTLSRLQWGGTIEEYRKLHPNCCYFYNSSDDYYNNNPIKEMELVPKSERFLLGSWSIEVIKNGQTEKVKVNTLKDKWMSDEYGNLVRFYDNDWYVVLVNGPLCYYVQYQNGFGNVDENKNYTLWSSFDGKFLDYYSFTLNGKVEKMDNKFFNGYLEKNAMKDAYDDDKVIREKHDSSMSYTLKWVNKRIRYTILMNEKKG